MDSKDLRELQARHRAYERYMIDTARALDRYQHGEIADLPKELKWALDCLLIRLDIAAEVGS